MSFNWRSDGRLEWLCEHGVGHTVHVPPDKASESVYWEHGCDGCCQKKNNSNRPSKSEVASFIEANEPTGAPGLLDALGALAPPPLHLVVPEEEADYQLVGDLVYQALLDFKGQRISPHILKQVSHAAATALVAEYSLYVKDESHDGD